MMKSKIEQTDDQKEIIRQLGKARERLNKLFAVADNVEYELNELEFLIENQEDPQEDHATIDYTYAQVEQMADLLHEIGLDPLGNYSIATIAQLRLAVEQILR